MYIGINIVSLILKIDKMSYSFFTTERSCKLEGDQAIEVFEEKQYDLACPTSLLCTPSGLIDGE